MFLKKRTDEPADDGTAVSAVLEPLPGHTEQEVVDFLNAQGAADVAPLAPGFISAQATRTALQKAQAIATVHIKPRKQPR